MRFQELDTDSEDDGHGVNLVSDELHFTGSDLGQHTRNRRVYDYSDNSEDDDEDEDEDEPSGSSGHMQVVLREKEEILVQRAMERIRRAQALGQTNVKLTEQERDALERKMAKDRAKGRKPLLANKKSNEAQRKSSKSNLIAQSNKKQANRSSLPKLGEGPNPPGLIVAGPDGQPIYAPIGYPPASSSRPNSRPGSSQNLRQSSPTTYRNPPRRYVSGPEAPSSRNPPPPRPLPDDPNWAPRPRSSSSTAQYAYPVDAYGRPHYPPGTVPPQYANPYPNVRPAPSGYVSASDPVLRRSGRLNDGRAEESGSSQSGSFSSSDGGAGVEVDVVPYGQGPGYEIVQAPTSKPPARAPQATRRKGRR